MIVAGQPKGFEYGICCMELERTPYRGEIARRRGTARIQETIVKRSTATELAPETTLCEI